MGSFLSAHAHYHTNGKLNVNDLPSQIVRQLLSAPSDVAILEMYVDVKASILQNNPKKYHFY